MDENKIDLNAKNERLFRSLRRQTSRTSSPIVRVESRNRSRSRDISRNNSFTSSLSLDKGGKKRTKKYRNKKSKRRKTRKNKKNI